MYYDDDQADIMHIIDTYDDSEDDVQDERATKQEPEDCVDAREILDKLLPLFEKHVSTKYNIANKYLIKYKVAKHFMNIDERFTPHALYPTVFDYKDFPIESVYPDDYLKAFQLRFDDNHLN